MLNPVGFAMWFGSVVLTITVVSTIEGANVSNRIIRQLNLGSQVTVRNGYLPPVSSTPPPRIILAEPSQQQVVDVQGNNVGITNVLVPPVNLPKIELQVTDVTKLATSTFRPTTEQAKFSQNVIVNEAQQSIESRNYLPPQPEYSGAAQTLQAAVQLPQKEEEHHHHHHHHHHHDENFNICDDPFHAFLCTPLKARKRITGAFPENLRGQASFLQPQKVIPDKVPASSNAFLNQYLPPSTEPPVYRTTPTRVITTTVPSTIRTTIKPSFSPAVLKETPSNRNDRFYLPPFPTNRQVNSDLPNAGYPNNNRNTLESQPTSNFLGQTSEINSFQKSINFNEIGTGFAPSTQLLTNPVIITTPVTKINQKFNSAFQSVVPITEKNFPETFSETSFVSLNNYNDQSLVQAPQLASFESNQGTVISSFPITEAPVTKILPSSTVLNLVPVQFQQGQQDLTKDTVISSFPSTEAPVTKIFPPSTAPNLVPVQFTVQRAQQDLTKDTVISSFPSTEAPVTKILPSSTTLNLVPVQFQQGQQDLNTDTVISSFTTAKTPVTKILPPSTAPNLVSVQFQQGQKDLTKDTVISSFTTTRTPVTKILPSSTALNLVPVQFQQAQQDLTKDTVISSLPSTKAPVTKILSPSTAPNLVPVQFQKAKQDLTKDTVISSFTTTKTPVTKILRVSTAPTLKGQKVSFSSASDNIRIGSFDQSKQFSQQPQASASFPTAVNLPTTTFKPSILTKSSPKVPFQPLKQPINLPTNIIDSINDLTQKPIPYTSTLAPVVTFSNRADVNGFKDELQTTETKSFDGYNYEKPEPSFPLPQDEKISETRTMQVSENKYYYPKPENILPLPSEQKQVAESQKPVSERTKYFYPKPEIPFELPEKKGYSYPKPENPLNLPKEIEFDSLLPQSSPLPTEILSDSDSAIFIPVNRLDKRSDSFNSDRKSKRFGERIRKLKRKVSFH